MKSKAVTLTLVPALLIALMLVANIHSLKTVSGASQTEWERAYPSLDAEGRAVIQTNDGGYAIAGGNNSRFLLLKVDSSGNLQWSKTYGYGIDDEISKAYCIVQTSDGGYALAGLSNRGSTNFVRTDSEGNMQWNKTIAKPNSPPFWVKSLVETSDGGFALLGLTINSYSNWVVKTDESGNIQWNRTYSMKYGFSLVEANDGGYMMNVGGDVDGFLVKIDVNGDVQWNVTCSRGESLIKTADGGYMLSGSSDGVGWLEKRDGLGEEEWRSGISGEGVYPYSFFHSVAQAPDGGYVVAGSVAEHVLHFGEDVARIVKTDSRGNKVWSEVYGEGCHANSVIVADDGKYAFTGSKSDDVWLTKIGEASTPTWTPSPTTSPSNLPSPTLSPSTTPHSQQQEPFPTALFVAVVASVAIFSIGLAVSFRKRKH